MTRHPRPAVDTTLARSPSDWLIALGAGHVLLGGLVAAVTEPVGLPHGSWLAAYLVLVCGVTQYAMGRASSWFDHPLAGCTGWTQVGAWNGGNVAVTLGTLVGVPSLVDVGGVVLLGVLVIALRSALQRLARTPAVNGRSAGTSRTVGVAYVALLVVLAGSVPFGLVLAHLRAG